MQAPFPENEAQRIEALQRYQILDTEAEPAFDDFTQLAALICGVPIALVSLVDSDRQWFKSKVGISATETKRDLAFCAHAILHPDLFVVPNALLDERFAHNALVTDAPHIRFYAGAPLINPEGYALGTLCVIDQTPRELNSQQLESLRAIARQVIAQLELRRNVEALQAVLIERQQAQITLQQAKEAAEAANRAKSTFLASMSHELRTPLNAILGFAQILYHDPTMSPTQKQNLEIINRSGEHLLELINSVLDLSKIEAGHLERSDSLFDLHSLIQTVDAMLQVRAVAKGIQLQVEVAPEVPKFVITDPGKLRQVLINLLGNGIKFTDQGSVTLRVRVGDLQAVTVPDADLDIPFAIFDVVHFEVQDTGVGIATEDIDRIFAAFEQTSSGKKLTEGTGLGLTLSQKLVNLLGGRVFARSTLGIGSTFEFDIPVRLDQSTEIVTRASRRSILGLTPGQPTYRILVVDDQPENRELLVQLLEPIGFSIELATHGEEAIALWQQWQPDLILMDIRMPILDGLQATTHIRQQEQAQQQEQIRQQSSILSPTRPHTQIIALSASVFHQDRDLALSAGCDGFLKKPFQVNDLLEKLADHIPVTYVYADPELFLSQEADEREFASALRSLPAEQVKHLCTAAQSGDDTAILKIVEQLIDVPALVITKLQHLTQQFEFERILSLLDNNTNAN